jgi:YVTN family beta-propeller protein
MILNGKYYPGRYMADGFNTTASVIDTATNRVVAVVQGLDGPFG